MQKNKNKTNQFLQIVLPLIVFLVGIGILTFFLIQNGLNGTTSLRMTGDIASIFLLLLILSQITVLLAIFVLLIYTTAKGTTFLKGLFPKMQGLICRVKSSINSICSVLVKPVIEIDSNFSIFKNQKSKESENAKEQ